MQRALGMLYVLVHGFGARSKGSSAASRDRKLYERKLATALGKYDDGRARLVQKLVPVLVRDVADYEMVFDEALSACSPGTVDRLQRLSDNFDPSAAAAAVAAATKDPRAPPTDSLAYIVYTRAKASVVSVELYTALCDIAAGLRVGGTIEVLPGGLKGEVPFQLDPRLLAVVWATERGGGWTQKRRVDGCGAGVASGVVWPHRQ